LILTSGTNDPFLTTTTATPPQQSDVIASDHWPPGVRSRSSPAWHHDGGRHHSRVEWLPAPRRLPMWSSVSALAPVPLARTSACYLQSRPCYSATAPGVIDWERRPRSVECLDDFRDIIIVQARPGCGWVKLPVPWASDRAYHVFAPAWR